MSDPLPSPVFASPSRALPRGACDTHAHVFGPYDTFPLADPRPYTPAPAPRGHHLAMLDQVGFDRGVLVHGSAHGWDHRAMLDAIAHAPDRLRGIGTVPGDTPLDELKKLHAGGVRGLRFTDVAGPTAAQQFDGRVGFDALHRLAPLMRQLGWHAVIWANAATLAEQASSLRAWGLPLVIDHMGYFDVAAGVAAPGFQTVRQLVEDGSAWVKLTVFRNSKEPGTHEDVRPFHEALLRANPERLLWGSDWPYLGMTTYRPTPAALLDLLDRWTGSDDLLHRILVTNPASLYGF
jgi:predicted TIM-barrel fold metal-dependent hydrolase